MENNDTNKNNQTPPKNTKRGRPIGSYSKFSVKAREEAQATGELPHEFMLRIVRGQRILQWTRTQDGTGWIREYTSPTLDDRIDCAKAVAPYFAPKFGTIEFQKNLTDAELAALLTQLAQEPANTGIGTGAEEEAGSPAEVEPPSVQKHRRRLR